MQAAQQRLQGTTELMVKSGMLWVVLKIEDRVVRHDVAAASQDVGCVIGHDVLFLSLFFYTISLHLRYSTRTCFSWKRFSREPDCRVTCGLCNTLDTTVICDK